jgi:hypothetical protein
MIMPCATSIKLAWLVGVLILTAGVATANEDGKYPDLRGQWRGVLRTVTVLRVAHGHGI